MQSTFYGLGMDALCQRAQSGMKSIIAWAWMLLAVGYLGVNDIAVCALMFQEVCGHKILHRP